MNRIDLSTDTKCFLINGIPYAFNSIYLRREGDNIQIYHQYWYREVIALTNYSQFYNTGTNAAFASMDSLLAWFQANAFK